jgi:A/G-specific adenine glycosylase
MINKQIQYFRQRLLHWHEHLNERQLPWKGEKDVYRIWLSEIILQQTRAEQGWKYYERFIKRFPTIQQLASAPIEEVFKLWEGLGYYSRCRNLHKSAQKIVLELKGNFPNTYESILELNGVGPYTAAAIASFAYNLPYAVVDGNVFRVLSRFFGEKEPIDSSTGKKLFAKLAQACLAQNKASIYNQAIMDFGATICKPDQPNCKNCVLKNKCTAVKEKIVEQLPVKKKQIKQRSRWFIFYILKHNKKYAVLQRTEKDVWQHLYQFPSEEFESEKKWKDAINKKNSCKPSPILTGGEYKFKSSGKPVFQKLSHQTIHAIAVIGELKGKFKAEIPLEWRTKDELKQLPFPKVIHQFFEANVLDEV